MLIIELDLARITTSQGGSHERGTMRVVTPARRTCSLRIALTGLIQSFDSYVRPVDRRL